MDARLKAILMALLAAALYGLSAPSAKLLLGEIPPLLLAALLYLGAGVGMLALDLIHRLRQPYQVEARLTRRELPFVIGMIILDIAAPIFLMIALTLTTAANASLLNNFEIVATTLIALLLFKEAIGRRMWLAIGLITLGSLLLSVADISSFSFSAGSLLVILACLCWGLENNCTRQLSSKDPQQIVVIKGFGSGLGALLIAIVKSQLKAQLLYILLAMLLGFLAYGLSIYFYILAQRTLGAARTSAYYAAAPFIGVLISILIFGQKISGSFIAAAVLMVVGAFFAATEYHRHLHRHEPVTHEHRHSHTDGHHGHEHQQAADQQTEHSHLHTHEAVEHTHRHTPDTHHTHRH
ncbi:MAG TPA: EamA family transporter [Clostridiales bacterium]|nr:EamA family transporter [Clostridiales bacterium]